MLLEEERLKLQIPIIGLVLWVGVVKTSTQQFGIMVLVLLMYGVILVVNQVVHHIGKLFNQCTTPIKLEDMDLELLVVLVIPHTLTYKVDGIQQLMDGINYGTLQMTALDLASMLILVMVFTVLVS